MESPASRVISDKKRLPGARCMHRCIGFCAASRCESSLVNDTCARRRVLLSSKRPPRTASRPGFRLRSDITVSLLQSPRLQLHPLVKVSRVAPGSMCPSKLASGRKVVGGVFGLRVSLCNTRSVLGVAQPGNSRILRVKFAALDMGAFHKGMNLASHPNYPSVHITKVSLVVTRNWRQYF